MKCLVFVLAFQVLYWTDDPKESTAGKVRVNGNITAQNITGLKANTVYFATVRAYNTAGMGPSSAPVNVTTKKSREYSISYNKCCRLPGGIVTFQLTMTQLAKCCSTKENGIPNFYIKLSSEVCD